MPTRHRVRAPTRRQAEPPSSGGSPRLHISAALDDYHVTLDVPPDVTIFTLDASLIDDGRYLQVEGTSGSSFEYYVRRRAPVCTRPASARIIGHVPAGSIIRAAAPRREWVELEGGEGWIPESHLELQRPARSHPFRTAVELPNDADIAGATQLGEREGFELRIPRRRDRRDEPTAKRYKVVRGGRIALRAAPNLQAAIIGVLHPGDVVCGIEAVRNWLRVAENTWVMIRHPQHGQLLQHIGVTTTTPPSAKPTPANQPNGTATRAPRSAKAGPETKEFATDPHAVRPCANGKMRAAVPQSEPVLVECPIDAVNVQRPDERSEEWNASPGGCFMKC